MTTNSTKLVNRTWLAAAIISALICFVNPQTAFAQQWTTTGNDISNANSGNVGVGTSTPIYKFDVLSTTAILGRFSSTAAANNQLLINAPSGFNSNLTLQHAGLNKWYLGNRAANDRFSFINAGSSVEVFSILQTGNVGIGTSSPGQRLNVIGNGLFGDLTSRTLIYSTFDSQQNPFLEVGYGAPHSAVTPFPVFVLSNNTTSTNNAEGIIGQFVFANRSIADNNDKRTAVITSWVDGASNSGTLQFYTSSAGTLAERLRINSAGNVGIGTSTPNANYKLDVNGEINATGIRINGTPISGGGSSQWTGTSSIYYNGGNVGIGTTSPSAKLELASNSAIKLGNAYFSSGGDYVHLANNEWYNGTSWIASAPGALIQISGQDINFYRHDAVGFHTQAMNINSCGKVGIGTISPVYSLDVNGGVNGFRAIAATTSSSDAIATF